MFTSVCPSNNCLITSSVSPWWHIHNKTNLKFVSKVSKCHSSGIVFRKSGFEVHMDSFVRFCMYIFRPWTGDWIGEKKKKKKRLEKKKLAFLVTIESNLTQALYLHKIVFIDLKSFAVIFIDVFSSTIRMRCSGWPVWPDIVWFVFWLVIFQLLINVCYYSEDFNVFFFYRVSLHCNRVVHANRCE